MMVVSLRAVLTANQSQRLYCGCMVFDVAAQHAGYAVATFLCIPLGQLVLQKIM